MSSRAVNTEHHRIVIIGGGSAGISVAARLFRALKRPDIAIIEPSEDHYYQPLWTLVGGGVFPKERTRRAEKKFIPHGTTWIKERVVEVCPGDNNVVTSGGRTVEYDYLVVAAGIQIDWGKIKGLEGHLRQGGLCTNYDYDQCEGTWETIRNFTGGDALFTQPSSGIKCAGAPQKIMYLADDHFRKAHVRDNTHITFISGTPAIFSVKEYAQVLNQVIKRKGIDTLFRHDLIEIRPDSHEAIFRSLADGNEVVMHYDMMHVTPFMSAPDFIKRSPLAQTADGPTKGYTKVDKNTLQNPDFPNIFAIGDCSALPTSKTGAAIRKQAPILVKNLLSQMRNETSSLPASYDGYTSCPLVTGYGRLVLAEFDYDLKPKETFPFNQAQERLSMYWLKAYGLPAMYWYGMLRGRM
ncbi:MAG TPA: FAD/NAD(P)-binding oxidoreductase [Ktedonobacteraceae bacterium]|nr:FAD/NAD(P)-binding oxidoreductase [Ktedonobacteraceae bacterium]